MSWISGRLAALALGAAALVVAVQIHWSRDALRTYDTEVALLPAFDSYVYVAEAENPRVFTVAPWGYRVLAPWIAALVPFLRLTAAFYVVAFASLAAATALLFLWLRALGHAPPACAAGAVVFGLSSPIQELCSAPFLVDLPAIAVFAALLLAIELDADVGVLVLLAVAGALTREVIVLFLPVVFFARRDRRHALRDAAVVCLAALAATLVLRRFWTPHVTMPMPWPDLDRVRELLAGVMADWRTWLRVVALGGLSPLALAAAAFPKGRRVLWRYGFVLLAAAAQPLIVYFNVQNVVGGFNRYLLFAVPVLVAAALAVVDRVTGSLGASLDPPRRPKWTRPVAAGAALVLAASPLVFVDRYRRLDLKERRDGVYILAFCRQTAATARRLAAGRTALFQMAETRFSPRGFEPFLFEHMRWFLHTGWGSEAHYGTDEVFMEEDRATLVLPTFVAKDMDVLLAMSAGVAAPLRMSLDGRVLGEARLTTTRERLRFHVPGQALVRGDNLLTLEVARAAQVRPRLYAYAVEPLAD